MSLISPALAGRFFTTSAAKPWAPREEETEWGGEERRGEERGCSRASQFGERHESLGKTNEKEMVIFLFLKAFSFPASPRKKLEKCRIRK